MRLHFQARFFFFLVGDFQKLQGKGVHLVIFCEYAYIYLYTDAIGGLKRRHNNPVSLLSRL